MKRISLALLCLLTVLLPVAFKNSNSLRFLPSEVLDMLKWFSIPEAKGDGMPSTVQPLGYPIGVYDDSLGTTYDITFTVKADIPMKITIDLRPAQISIYRINWELDQYPRMT